MIKKSIYKELIIVIGIFIYVMIFPSDIKAQKQNSTSVQDYNYFDTSMVLIPSGNFIMGSPNTKKNRGKDELQHKVSISYSFYIGKYEVTQKEYQKLMGQNLSAFRKPKFPVENVSWWDAIKYCNKLSKIENQPLAYNDSTGELIDSNGNITDDITLVSGYRLPTEAEWEYAARAGSTSAYYTGYKITKNEASFGERTFFKRNKKLIAKPKTVNGNKFSPNAWGVYNIYGNVWEWCNDWYNSYKSEAQINPVGDNSGTVKILRGGAWNSRAKECRSAKREKSTQNFRCVAVGFRICKTQ